MYTPPFNRVEVRPTINAFIHAHGFATLITDNGGKPWASHLPVLLDESADGPGALRSHMARANEQWKHFESGREVLCIFHGPHAYISPSWYVEQHTVPTWNYATVHVYGVPAIADEAMLRQIVYDTVAQYELSMTKPWAIPLSEREMDGMLKAIVGFKIDITRMEAKFKLGQNRSKEDQDKMTKALAESPNSADQELARFIRAQCD